MGVVSRRCMWVESIGEVVRIEVYTCRLLIPTPLVSVFFCNSIPTLCSFCKMFCVLVPVLFVIKFYV